jgi:hypothetical protein
MTPERMAGLVAWWVRFYTRGLPTAIARRRIGEIDADLHDHVADARARGADDRRIAAGVLSRMVRGVPADVSWRRRVRPAKGIIVKTLLAILGVALGVAVIVLGGMDDAPGAQLLGLLLIVGIGTWYVRRVVRGRRPATDAGPRE